MQVPAPAPPPAAAAAPPLPQQQQPAADSPTSVLAAVSDSRHGCTAQLRVPRSATAADVLDALCADAAASKTLHLDAPPVGVARSGVRLRAYLPAAGSGAPEFRVLSGATRLGDGAVGVGESAARLWLEQRSEDGSWPWGEVPLEALDGGELPPVSPAAAPVEWAAALRAGSFVDAKDETGQWCKAVVRVR